MNSYRYQPLGSKNIRLLNILPSKDSTADLKCDILEYSLFESNTGDHTYEALSYTWGGEHKPETIIVDDSELRITQNLYAALRQFRNHQCPRLLWVDAVCINQEMDTEKEQQIRLMAAIYASASRVIVWLGEAGDSSDQALEAIRLAAERSGVVSEPERPSVRQLLQRSWFSRIWVLQEVAAARHIMITCGTSRLDGHAFSRGLDSIYANSTETKCLVPLLMRRAAYRPRNALENLAKPLPGFRSLGELLDMYHLHKASRRHDKLYALLGMTSDDCLPDVLQPNYSTPWRIVMAQLVSFVLGEHVSVKTWDNNEVALIECKGSILGSVETQEASSEHPDCQKLKVRSGISLGGSSKLIQWTLQNSANTVLHGDLVCLVEGASKPTIIRCQKDHFAIIAIAAAPKEYTEFEPAINDCMGVSQSRLFTHRLLLTWDLGPLPKNREFDDQLSNLTRTESAVQSWNIALVLEDSRQKRKASRKRREASIYFGLEAVNHSSHVRGCQCELLPLLWASAFGDHTVAKLITMASPEALHSADYLGQTPLFKAASNGHLAVVRLLLETSQDEVNVKDLLMRTPLSSAAFGGHETVVETLLETGQVEVDTEDNEGRTPLFLAAWQGHDRIVSLLLQSALINPDSRDDAARTPLLVAAEKGSAAVVKLLLQTGQVDPNKEDSRRRTPLIEAAANGHDLVVDLILKTGQVNVDHKGSLDMTALSHAVKGGWDRVVKLLIMTGQVDLNVKDDEGRTPLSLAAENGHHSVMKLLLETREVDPNLTDVVRRTPLSYAAEQGHEEGVKLLLEGGKVELNKHDAWHKTALLYSVSNKHTSIVQLLLQTRQVDLRHMDEDGETALSLAREFTDETMFSLLSEAMKGDGLS